MPKISNGAPKGVSKSTFNEKVQNGIKNMSSKGKYILAVGICVIAVAAVVLVAIFGF